MIGKPKPGRRPKRAPTAPTRSVRADVIRRDGGRCQWCGAGVDTSSGWYSLQHRRARQMGGTSRPEANLAANLVLVHGTGTTGCHGEIEANPVLAAERGFRLTQEQQPDQCPIQVAGITGRRWVRLDNDGNTRPTIRRAA